MTSDIAAKRDSGMMKTYSEVISRDIQRIGEECFPDDAVQWTVNRIFTREGHVFADVTPDPGTVGYEKFVFVIRFDNDQSYRVTSCYYWDNEWAPLFSDQGEDRDWTRVLGNSTSSSIKIQSAGKKRSRSNPNGDVIDKASGGGWSLFSFSLPFILAGLAMLLGAISGDARDRLALILGGSVFLTVGLFIWSAAFPGIASRLRRSESPILAWLADHARPIGVSLIVIVMFGTPMLIALGIIQTSAPDWRVPRWIAIVTGGIFMLGGAYILTYQRIQRMKPGLRKHILGLFPLLIATGMAAIADWLAFGSFGRFGIETGGGDSTDRIVFGLAGVFLTVSCLIAWWKYLRGRW